MRKKILIIISIILIVAGICVIMTPPVSTVYSTEAAKIETENFDKQTDDDNIIPTGSYEAAIEQKQIDTDGYLIDDNNNRTSDTPVHYKTDLDKLYKDSVEYNKNLVKTQATSLVDTSYDAPALNLNNYGIFDNIYGYISAPTIDMKQPIYLGANDTTMAYGVGHLCYTSLPIGGESTNTVLAAHTGYFGKTFFDNLLYLKKGDPVYIKNYWNTLEYKVIASEVHVPNDSYEMYIKDGKDLLTLVTCIYDNGQNNRLYIICERVN